MARRAGPSARSRRLARTLRRLRFDADLSAAEVGKAVGMSGSKINRIETVDSGIYLDDLEKLLDFYRVSAKRRVELLDIARNAEQRGWLRMRNANLHTDWLTWSDFEDEATRLLQYESMMIPGLLQTYEYARTVITATANGLTAEQVDALVESRMARQGLLGKAVPVQLRVVLEETLLSRPFGDDGAHARQIRHLANAAERPNVTIQLLPTDVGIHQGVTGSFVVLEYDEEPSLVWMENYLASVFLEEDEQIDAYSTAWEDLATSARTPDESIDLLRTMVV